ncbi:MAG TPA: DUF3427 domain-containing protein [Chloroflexota bacterium]|nr:DUF3427 domain-containing protein [Chloroflexota bacterium]
MSDDGATLPPGLYEQLLTEALLSRVPRDRSELRDLVPESSHLLTLQVARALNRALSSTRLDMAQSVALCNQLLIEISQSDAVGAVVPGDRIPSPAELLTAIRPPLSNVAQPSAWPRPETPLSEDALLVNAPHEPTLAAELRTEILSADGVDLLCAFIVWNGIRIFRQQLEEVAQRGVPIRVITTTYTGTTEPRALDELARIGAEIKVSYDTRATRLHAKAWLFERASGFSTAYIGSSNLTHSALHQGLEWNVRLTQARSPALLDRFRAAFETYWSDAHFRAYRPDEFAVAVQRTHNDSSTEYTPFDIVPFEYQRAMLDTLEAERMRHGRWRNLVVAATGTGKTIVAALDYKRVAEQWKDASLLFVAHRQEILEQSRHLFRNVLRDGSFGELMVGGQRPLHGRHVFASIQSLSHADLASMPRDAYDVVIVDEFHHAEAPTYRRLLEHIEPRLLLGLTATPERADQGDILRWFDGHIAVDLRLWEAIDQGLLCPFQYFGVADDVDLSALEWKRTGYDTHALSSLYTANEFRTAKILQAVHDVVSDQSQMRALGFCVSVEHADYMATSFTKAGIPSCAVTGGTAPAERARIIKRLRSREINTIFTVDVFNEGVDIPELDTILLLRPTESVTVFLQQLGRGLRLSEGKAGLTVLDFIGQQRREFRFGPRFQALTDLSAKELPNAVEHGFPYLPSGCYIQLDRVATRIVLDNLRQVSQGGRDLLVRELRGLGDVSLAEFLKGTGRSLDDIYRWTRPGWMNLRRDAGLRAPARDDGDLALTRAVGRMTYVDDRERLDKYRTWLVRPEPPSISALSERDIRLLNMLHVDLQRGTPPTSLADSLARLWPHEGLRLELAEVLGVLAAQTDTLAIEDRSSFEPLAVHARYSRDEVLAALGAATPERPRPLREGVMWAEQANADIFFVTLRKSDKHFSPTTMYRDYAISPWLFHWESQSTTSVASPTGQRYINHAARGSRVLIFARELPTQPFVYLGPATHVRHEGDRPISIVWQLEWEIPPLFFLAARAAS